MMNENIANMPAEFQLLPTAMGSTSEIEISVQFDPESLPVDTLLAADVEVTELESLEPVSGIEEAAEAAQQRRGRSPEKPPTHDPVLQRALDVVTSLEIYQKR